jgi:P-type Cu2+ transporter
MKHKEHNHTESKHKHDHHTEHGSSGHDKHAGHNVSDFWKRFIICSIVSIPVLALSHMIQQWLGV